MASLCCCCCLLCDLGGIPVGWVRLGFWSPYFQKRMGRPGEEVLVRARLWGHGYLPSGAVSVCPSFVRTTQHRRGCRTEPRWAPERIGRCTEPPEDVTEKGGRLGRRQGSISWVVGRGGFGSSSTRICEGAFWAKGMAGVRALRQKRRKEGSWNGACHSSSS